MAEQHRRREYMLPDIDSTFRVFAAHQRTVDREWRYPLHQHPLFEVNLVLSGTQVMVVNGKQYVQQAGDLMLLRPGDMHEGSVLDADEMTYYCLHFDVDERAFRELLYRNNQYFYEADSMLAASLRPALDKLLALTSEESVMSVETRMRLLSALFELFAAISSALSRQLADEPKRAVSLVASEAAALLEAAVDTLTEPESGKVRAAEAEAITVSSIAAQLGYSPSTINRLFSRAYGMSPRQYRSMLLLKKSKLLLMDPELSIEEISLRMGYTNIAHFSRQFKRWAGESPSRFRRRYQE